MFDYEYSKKIIDLLALVEDKNREMIPFLTEKLAENIITDKISTLTLNGINFQMLLSEAAYGDENNDSLIIYFNFNGLDYLYLGDIYQVVEHDLVNTYPSLNIDVMKLAHHGSKTSTSQKLLDTYFPKLTIISSGYNNFYHHPSSEVTRRLLHSNIIYLNTAEVGDLKIVSITGLTNFLLTKGGLFVIME